MGAIDVVSTVGGSLVWLGAAIYGVGIGGWATLYYFGTDPTALDAATAARLIDHANDDTARMLAVPIGGALLVALGSMLLALALWRARTVPRWIPIVAAVSAVTGIVLPPDTVAGIVGEAASSATAIAIGWYAWQRPGPRRRLRDDDETAGPSLDGHHGQPQRTPARNQAFRGGHHAASLSHIPRSLAPALAALVELDGPKDCEQ